MLRIADLEINLLARAGKARWAGGSNCRTPGVRITWYLARHAGHVVTRTMLLENVWNFHFDPRTNIVKVMSAGCGARLTRMRPNSLKPFVARDTVFARLSRLWRTSCASD